LKPICGQTRLYCLIGNPVAHSLSPWIMNRALTELNHNAFYAAFQVDVDCLATAIPGLKSLRVRGANVTYPHKEAVVPLIDKVSPEVSLLGASNTLMFTEDGIAGFNTDALGTSTALEHFGSCKIAGKSAVILGAGGAARAAALGLLNAGIKELTFLVRNCEKTKAATSRLREHFPDKTFGYSTLAESCDEAARVESINTAQILINATPIGMDSVESNQSPLADDVLLHSDLTCLEMIYHPRRTVFLSQCEAANCRSVEGLGLLVAQAQRSLQIWTGETFDLDEMYDTLIATLGDKA
jgi:shikimate dehydrogenase